MKKSKAQLNIHTYKSRKVYARNTTLSYAHSQNFLLCAMTVIFGMRRRRSNWMRRRKSIWYAQAQVNLVCAGASQFGMRRRRSIWYAQAQVILVCAGAGHFCMRRCMPVWYPHAQVNFSSAVLCQIFVRTRSSFFFYAQESCLVP